MPFTAAAVERPDDAATEKLIEKFSSSAADVASANRFMKILEKDELLEEPFSFGADTPADSLRQQVWYWAAEWYYERQQYERAGDYARKALPLFSYNGTAKADCLNLLAIISVRLSDFTKAATYAKQCLAIDMKTGDVDRISSSLNTLAGTYMAAGSPEQAEKYILQGLEYAEKADNASRKAILLGMASEVYYKTGDFGKSLDYANRAYSLDSLTGNARRLPVRLSQRAAALAGLDRTADAESTYRSAIAALREVGNVHSLAIDLNQLGQLLLKQQRSEEAIACFSEAASIFGRMGDLYNLVHSHKGLYESYWDSNRDSAKVELERFNILKDSLYSQATAETLARYTAEFDNERLRSENDDLQRRHRNNTILWIILAIMVVVVPMSMVRLVSRRHRKQIQALIERIESLEEERRAEAKPKDVNVVAPGEVKPTCDDFITCVVAEVERGLSCGEYGVAQIAAKMNISEQTFRRRVSESTGKSPKIFISAIQMSRAAKLLTDNRRMSVGDVASACGFGDAETFSRAFKRTYGCSPSRYCERLSAEKCKKDAAEAVLTDFVGFL